MHKVEQHHMNESQIQVTFTYPSNSIWGRLWLAATVGGATMRKKKLLLSEKFL